MDTIDRLPQTGDKGIYLKQQLKDSLIEHKQYIDKNGEDLPEIRNLEMEQTQMNAARTFIDTARTWLPATKGLLAMDEESNMQQTILPGWGFPRRGGPTRLSGVDCDHARSR